MFSVVDSMLSTLKSMDEVAAETVAATGPSEWATSHLPEKRFSGIHHEPKAGALPAPGNRRQREPYIFVNGKRVSTARTRRFAAK